MIYLEGRGGQRLDVMAIENSRHFIQDTCTQEYPRVEDEEAGIMATPLEYVLFICTFNCRAPHYLPLLLSSM